MVISAVKTRLTELVYIFFHSFSSSVGLLLNKYYLITQNFIIIGVSMLKNGLFHFCFCFFFSVAIVHDCKFSIDMNNAEDMKKNEIILT